MRRVNLSGLKPEQKLAVFKVKYIQNIITSIIVLGILLFALKANLGSIFLIFIIPFIIADIAYLFLSMNNLFVLNNFFQILVLVNYILIEIDKLYQYIIY